MLKKLIVLMVTFLVSMPIHGRQNVNWMGDWKVIKKSVVPDIPIIGSLEETSRELQLEFVGDLGDVEVTVTDALGQIVCQETVSTATTSVWSYTLDPSAMGGTVTVTDGENVVYGMLNI